MINENIKSARKAKGFTQEEMAIRLNVVRQTISKWEKGLSVPDADMLIKIAELLEVPVTELLGVSQNNMQQASCDTTIEELTKQLADLNEQLAMKKQEHELYQKAGKKRGLILMLCFLSMLIAMSVKNELVSILLVGGCVLAALVILYRNLALLTMTTSNEINMDVKIGSLKVTTIFNISILLATVAIIALDRAAIIQMSQADDRLLALLLVSVIMLFVGYMSPKLPYNRHTGLRLPWTVQDEDTWNLAHKILGYISLPLMLLYIAASFTIANIANFETITMIIILLWIGIPGFLSMIFWRKKYYGKLFF